VELPRQEQEPQADNSVARSVTITDVARLAGVSVGTVSNYLNGTARLAEKTAEAVRSALSELEYEPNLNARSLRSQATGSLALLVPNVFNPFYGEIAALVEAGATERGYQLLLCVSGDDSRHDRFHLRALHQRRVDGALLVIAGATAPDDLDNNTPYASVFLDRVVASRLSVTTDNHLGGRLAMEHLISRGHRRIAMVIGDEHVENVRRRLTGATEVLAEHGLAVAPEHVIRGEQSVESGREASRFWELEEPPTAVFTTNDVVAIGVWQSCLVAGKRVPDDVALMGYDGIEWSRLTVPPLSTVRQDLPAMTTMAMELLFARIHGERPSNEVRSIPPSLVIRESTGRIDDG
jgi:DNA-binding LacI/PurR family transcriptional regulator